MLLPLSSLPCQRCTFRHESSLSKKIKNKNPFLWFIQSHIEGPLKVRWGITAFKVVETEAFVCCFVFLSEANFPSCSLARIQINFGRSEISSLSTASCVNSIKHSHSLCVYKGNPMQIAVIGLSPDQQPVHLTACHSRGQAGPSMCREPCVGWLWWPQRFVSSYKEIVVVIRCMHVL